MWMPEMQHYCDLKEFANIEKFSFKFDCREFETFEM